MCAWHAGRLAARAGGRAHKQQQQQHDERRIGSNSGGSEALRARHKCAFTRLLCCCCVHGSSLKPQSAIHASHDDGVGLRAFNSSISQAKAAKRARARCDEPRGATTLATSSGGVGVVVVVVVACAFDGLYSRYNYRRTEASRRTASPISVDDSNNSSSSSANTHTQPRRRVDQKPCVCVRASERDMDELRANAATVAICDLHTTQTSTRHSRCGDKSVSSNSRNITTTANTTSTLPTYISTQALNYKCHYNTRARTANVRPMEDARRKRKVSRLQFATRHATCISIARASSADSHKDDRRLAHAHELEQGRESSA